MSGLVATITAPNGISFEQPLGLFIDNEFVKSARGEKLVSVNPTTEKQIAAVFAASELDVDLAVGAARRALNDPSWKHLSPSDRGSLMFRLADLIEASKEILATIEALDNGKPYSVALHDDIPEVLATLRYYAGWCDKISGQTIVTSSTKFAYTIRQPIGVVGQIIPWNFPLSMAAWKLGPALACGNTVVLKAAEQTPLSILYFAALVVKAGFPRGVINILNGQGQDCGAAIVSHPDIDKVAFTGSTATGQQVMKMASKTLKNITLETGGKSPLIVFEDADLEQAAKWAHMGIMYNQGQVCSATSRLLVHESVHDRFVEMLKRETIATSKVGDPFDPATFQGPQVSRDQYERVLSYIETGKAESATLAFGGKPLKCTADGRGFFVEPTIFTDVKPFMRVYTEEIFGPVVVVTKFESDDEALRLANDSVYGLGASVFTQNIERHHRFAHEIDSGMVWVNSSNDLDIRVPFGGVKQSGIGRELGESALDAYSQIKAIRINVGCKL